MELAHTRFYVLELFQLKEIFLTLLLGQACSQSVLQYLLGSEGRGASVLPGRFCHAFKLLLRIESCLPAGQLVLSHSTVDSIYNGANGRGGPVRLAIDEFDIVIVISTEGLSRRTHLLRPHVLPRRRGVFETHVVRNSTKLVLRRCSCDPVLSCKLIESQVVPVVTRLFGLDLVRLPSLSHCNDTTKSKV